MSDPPRVLVVDDEMGVRESLRAILGDEYDVLTASSGAEALDLVARERIDVMTVDLRMPGLGGIAVLERVRRLDPDLEVLIVTGCGSLDTAVQGLRFRAFDYISKPFDAAEIRGLIHKAAARRAAMRRLRAAPDHLLATLSHELRTPLNVIMGYSTILRDEDAGPLSEEQRLALERIQANSTTLLSYIETLFYIADVDRGRVPLTVTPVRVADVLGRVGGELGTRALEKGLAWRLDAPADLMLQTDEDKLLRLVRVLADNAVRFTTTGEVAVVARPAAGGVRVEVLDSGPGLPQELIAETEDAIAGRPAERPGRQVGFGLRLAGRLVRLLGGSLTFAASPRGTSCQLVVPDLAAGDRPAVEAASA